MNFVLHAIFSPLTRYKQSSHFSCPQPYLDISVFRALRSTSDQAWIFLQPQMLCAKVFLIPLQYLFDFKNGGVNGRQYICLYALIDVVCCQY